jgi:hypothetical protein
MAKRRRGKKTQAPKFPRRRWLPGQVERAEPPKKGGPYDRARERWLSEEDIEESQDEQ